MSEKSINNLKKGESVQIHNSNPNAINYSSFYQNNNFKNQRAINKINNKSKKLKINSLSELEFLYNDSQIKTTISNKPIKIKKKNIMNLSSYNLSSKSGILSPQNNKNSTKNKSKHSFNNFWKSVKEHEKERKAKINNLKAQAIMKENSQMKSRPYICKKSLSLANLKQREPLYLERPLNEETYLEKDFLKFYKNNMDLNSTNKDKSLIENEEKVKEKYNKIYKDNIEWKKNKNEKLKCAKNKNSENNKKNYSFKPQIDKNSIHLVKKLEKINSADFFPINGLNKVEYEKELLDQLKVKLKPVLSECFDIQHRRVPHVNKKSYLLINNSKKKSYNKTKNLNINKTYQKPPISNIKKTNEKTGKVKEKKNNIIQLNKEPEKKLFNNITYEKYLIDKFKEIEKLDKKRKKELYKINVRQGTSWNSEYVNNVIQKKEYKFIINSLL